MRKRFIFCSTQSSPTQGMMISFGNKVLGLNLKVKNRSQLRKCSGFLKNIWPTKYQHFHPILQQGSPSSWQLCHPTTQGCRHTASDICYAVAWDIKRRAYIRIVIIDPDTIIVHPDGVPDCLCCRSTNLNMYFWSERLARYRPAMAMTPGWLA